MLETQGKPAPSEYDVSVYSILGVEPDEKVVRDVAAAQQAIDAIRALEAITQVIDVPYVPTYLTT